MPTHYRHLLLVLTFLLPTFPLRAADPPLLPGVTQRLVVAGQGFFPVAQRLRDGRVAVVLRGGAAHVGIKGRLDIVFSADAGRTFSKPTVVVDSPLDDRNPAFGQAADGALVVAFWRAARDTYKDYEADRPDQPVSTHVTRSADGGRTWSDPAEIDVRDIGYGSPYGKILTLPDGSMLMNVYGFAPRKPGEPLADKTDYSYLYRSTDNGRTWTRHATIARGFNETGLLALPDGTLLAALRTQAAKANVSLARSPDGGRTWSDPKELTAPSDHPADLTRLPDGRLLLVTGHRTAPFGVRGLVSDKDLRFDHSAPFTLANDSATVDTGYPSTVLLEDGRALTFYYATASKTHPDWATHCAVVDYKPPAP
jgi:hypothetical protein